MAKIKMTPEQKEERKALLGLARAEGAKLIHNFQTTIVYREYGNVVRFATSVHSPKEPNADFSRKYGEYLALDRAFNGCDVPMVIGDFHYMCQCMDMYPHSEHKENGAFGN